jgi:UDP-N-acetylmuramate--alanine ligase
MTKGSEEKATIVVEADEYDRSFLRLHPDIAVITSMDADHLDIYGDQKQMEESYQQFANQSKLLFAKKNLSLTNSQKQYSLSGDADYSASNIHVDNHQFHFNWNNRTSSIDDIILQMPGRHNIENAVAAIAVARQLNIENDNIKNAIQSYSGVKRRFDYQINRKDCVYIDDYAHHPEELRACISAVRELYPDKKITGIFQPHLFSRTRDFVEGFGKSLSLLDELILLDIYPAREKPMAGITSKIIYDKVDLSHKMMCTKELVLGELQRRKVEVLLTLGAGDIDQLVEPII